MAEFGRTTDRLRPNFGGNFGIDPLKILLFLEFTILNAEILGNLKIFNSKIGIDVATYNFYFDLILVFFTIV